MSAIANITVFDGAATPVSHTLLAVSVTRDKGRVEAFWRESLASLPAYAQVRCTMSIERLRSGVYKTEKLTEVPVMEAVLNQNAAGYTAAPKVAHTMTIRETGLFHERSDVAGRRLIRQMSINIDGNISTSVAAATTGPLPELFDLLVAPT